MSCNIFRQMVPKSLFVLLVQNLKIKFYIEVRGIKMDNYADYDAANAAADAKIEAIKKELGI